MAGTASLTSEARTLSGSRTVLIGGLALGLIALTAAILLMMGRTPICTCGTVELWHGTVKDSGNSQHLTDWYTPSHVIHGFLFYLGAWSIGVLRGKALPLGVALLLAIGLEATWEIAENTDSVIDRYRATTIALDYYGDSVVNSVADMMAMIIGFGLASRLPVTATIAIALVLELGVGYWIRDNLTLNVIMLLYPLDVIKAWQSGV